MRRTLFLERRLLEEDSECQSIRVSHVPLKVQQNVLKSLPEYLRQCRSIDKLATDVSEMEIDRGLDRDEIIHFTQPHRGFRTIDNPIVGMGGSSRFFHCPWIYLFITNKIRTRLKWNRSIFSFD